MPLRRLRSLGALAGRAARPEEDAELDAYLAGAPAGRRTIDRFWADARFGGAGSPNLGPAGLLFTNLTWDSAVIGQEVAFASIQTGWSAAIEAIRRRAATTSCRAHPPGRGQASRQADP